jgi:hypothetical protein
VHGRCRTDGKSDDDFDINRFVDAGALPYGAKSGEVFPAADANVPTRDTPSRQAMEPR